MVIDDCWHAPSRNSSPPHKPLADPIRFPDGIKAVAGESFLIDFLIAHIHLVDKLHALGLKLGIYSSAGTYTCAKHFGSLGFEEVDAQTYAEWGVDYLSILSFIFGFRMMTAEQSMTTAIMRVRPATISSHTAGTRRLATPLMPPGGRWFMQYATGVRMEPGIGHP